MIKQYVKKNGTKTWMFNEYIGTDPTTGKKKIVTKRGFKSEKEAKTTLNRMKMDFERGSQRVIALDVKTIKVIEQWRYNQKEWYFKFGYNTSKDTQFLFTNKFNELYYPQAPNDWLYNILEKYDLPKITLHGFRHTHASLLFESGASIKEVQERLGHKDVKTTMNIYTHVTPEKVRETGERFAKYVNF